MPNIVVEIDLGTSRSAWAYSTKGRCEDSVMIRVSEGSTPFDSGTKTETAVVLNAENADVQAFGRAAHEQFIEQTELEKGEVEDSLEMGVGQVVRSYTMLLFRWFKVALCEKRGYQSMYEPVATAEGGEKRPLVQVVVSVLRHLKKTF